MSYRKIEVNGKTYEYSIGRTHTKIRGVGAYKNEDVGKEYNISDSFCADWETYKALQVRPSDLASFIKRNKL